MGGLAVVASALPRDLARSRAASAEAGAVFVAAALAVLAVAAAQGGYFPDTWGWATLAFAWVAATALALRRDVELGGVAFLYLGGFAALAGWTLLSLAWSPSGRPVFEAERALMYAAAAAAVLVSVRRTTVGALVGGVLAGIVGVSAYAVATRLLPDHFGSQTVLEGVRLTTPIGYWNGVGIVAVLGILVALGLAARARTAPARALAAGSLPILVPTLYFTFSRGSWLALGLGLLVLVAVDARRLQLVTVAGVAAVPALLAVALAWHAKALSTAGASTAAAASEGHPLARRLAFLVLAGVLVSCATTAVAGRVSPPRRARRAYGALLLALAIGAVAAGVARGGGPTALAQRGWHSFTGPAVAVGTGGRESSRLFSLSSNDRIVLWRSAWQEAHAHALAGGGGGSFSAWWLRHRPTTQQVRDAHSLYLQTLAELGVVGLALLLLTLLAPVVVGVRARRHPLVPAVLAAYVAFLLHAAGDWDWQLAGVTLPAVVLGASLVVARREDPWRGTPRRFVRAIAIAAAVAAGVVAVPMILGNVPLSHARAAAAATDWTTSARTARKAIRWLPWSSEPWRMLGEADLAQRRHAAAAVALRRAIELDPTNWQLWFDLSAATRGTASRHALARAAALNPRSPDIAQLRSLEP